MFSQDEGFGESGATKPIPKQGSSKVIYRQGYIMDGFKILVILLWALGLSACLGETPPEGMVVVKGGSFLMGTNEVDSGNRALALGLLKPWYADESPQRSVNLPTFFIDRYEVTNQRYYIFAHATDHFYPKYWEGQKYRKGRENHPVTQVNFYDAAAFCEWEGKRLPTEAEWEKAARGIDNYIYPWGNEFDPTAANVSLSPRRKRGRGLKAVGSFPSGVSFFGVYDLIGNAWEWVWDYYHPYPGSKYKHPDYDRKMIVVRGMSYMGVGHFAKKDYEEVVKLKSRASFREKLNPISRKNDVGFRCVREPT